MRFDTTSIICVSRCNYRDEMHVQNHCHNFYHLIYVTGGNGNLVINGEENRVLEDDVYMIHPWVYHEIIADDKNPLRTIEVKFVANDEYLNKELSIVPLRFNNKNMNLKMMIINLVDEAINKRPYYKELITANCIEILLHMMRSHFNDSIPDEGANLTNYLIHEDKYGNELVNQVLRYIHKNYTSKITLGDLAKLFIVNQAHLCRIFSKQFGVSPIQYVNNLRLQKAKEMLSSTELSITEISETVGFNSIHYLSRYFTSKEKISPIEFRHKAKENVNVVVEEKYKIVNYKI